MNTTIHERHDKKRTALYYSGDGLADIYTGLIVFSFGMVILADLAWMAGVFAAVFVPTWLSVKQSLIASRLTEDELERVKGRSASDAKVRLLVMGLIALAVGLLAFFLLTSNSMPEQWRLWLSENFSTVSGVFAGLALALFGAIIKSPRFYGYAVLAVAIIAGSSLLSVEFPLAVIALGSVIFGVGIVFLIHFLRTHPKIENPPQG